MKILIRSDYFSLSFWWRLVGISILILILGMFVSVRPAEADTDVITNQPAPHLVPLPDVTLSTGSVMLGENFTISAKCEKFIPKRSNIDLFLFAFLK